MTTTPWLCPTTTIRLRLDVDIGGLGIELSSMPNQPSIGIRLQYQSHCLDVDKIGRWNQSSWGIPIHVWMSTLWHLILSTPREAGEEPHGSPVEEQRGTRRGGGQGRGAPPPSTLKAPAALRPLPPSPILLPILLRGAGRISAAATMGKEDLDQPWGRRWRLTGHGGEGGARPAMADLASR